jgi:hypothetical protein
MEQYGTVWNRALVFMERRRVMEQYGTGRWFSWSVVG